jgi:hypothetical protein
MIRVNRYHKSRTMIHQLAPQPLAAAAVVGGDMSKISDPALVVPWKSGGPP